MPKNITLIGFGEVGQTLAKDLLAKGKAVFVYDILFDDANSKPVQALKTIAVNICDSHIEAAQKGDLIISCVTAAQTTNAAKSVAEVGLGGKFYLDVNSSSPASKLIASGLINAAGGKYIEASVMSPIAPKNINSPILLGGPYAEEAEGILRTIGFGGAKYYSDEMGKAAATKLCRSVMIKGLEALISESMISAYHYGVQDEVLQSLNNLFPHPDWKQYAYYMITRTLEHGKRRSEEMLEAAKTVEEAGLEPIMSLATAKRQSIAPKYKEALKQEGLDALIREIRHTNNVKTNQEETDGIA
jgi:3-hydroxyisobutyrate dehydrogenase-like beta-hydroxyacid dehydrogenase